MKLLQYIVYMFVLAMPLCFLSDLSFASQVKEVPKGIGGEVFERTGGYFHPYLSITGYWLDNIYNTKDNKKSDYMLVVSPGLWIAVPRLKKEVPPIETSTIMPGGFTLSRRIKQYPRRYQMFFIYKADIELFKRYTSENFVNHMVEVRGQYNMRGGLSVDVNEQFKRSHDMRGSTPAGGLDKFHSNLFSITLRYDSGHRIAFRTDYVNYRVDYRNKRSDFRDRTDSLFSLYLFYKTTFKTAVFLEYDFIQVNYDNYAISDSSEQNIYGGIRWRITAKSEGQIKGGYGLKDFRSPQLKTGKHSLLEARIEHQFTPKTSVKITALKKTAEADMSGAHYTVSHLFKAEYSQRLTSKITVAVGGSYELLKYKGDVKIDGQSGQRTDRIYRLYIALSHEYKQWLTTEAGYLYSCRDSNFHTFDFTSNTLFLRLKGML